MKNVPFVPFAKGTFLSVYSHTAFVYQKALKKHMQGGVWMPCLLRFYVCWIIKMYTGEKNRYMLLNRV